MKKLTLAKKKIVFLIVIAVIFLIAIGVILLLIFIQNKKTIESQQTLEQRMTDVLNSRFQKPIEIDSNAAGKVLNDKYDDSEKTEADKEVILNLLNQINK